eukprot:CAMPEP_0182442160 /NCGR_PEP_ID=MMETSP1172-20130603/1114_1 /TAXON_ID=708627 /ORGANISM="Timspurckia oligopyrenoides, Strain CCMP3278" /LENGTH=257 /DNA_ID=CAMNT_0024636873 /DNA_START=70 /DNA_END=840 /DNA_ORIENTATION=-
MMRVAVEVVSRACGMSRRVQKSFSVGGEIRKSDASPVTVADFAVQALILSDLHEKFPTHKFIAEETSTALNKDPELCQTVIDVVNEARSNSGFKFGAEEICSAIDLGKYDGTDPEETVWVLDPIDGTKGFMRMEQFCIALGVLQQGKAVLGILGCPNLNESLDGSGPRGVIFHAIKGEGSYMQTDDITDVVNTKRLSVSDVCDPMYGVFMESVESAHSSHALSAQVAAMLGVKSAPIRMDSQAKYGVIARGETNLFM